MAALMDSATASASAALVRFAQIVAPTARDLDDTLETAVNALLQHTNVDFKAKTDTSLSPPNLYAMIYLTQCAGQKLCLNSGQDTTEIVFELMMHLRSVRVQHLPQVGVTKVSPFAGPRKYRPRVLPSDDITPMTMGTVYSLFRSTYLYFIRAWLKLGINKMSKSIFCMSLKVMPAMYRHYKNAHVIHTVSNMRNYFAGLNAGSMSQIIQAMRREVVNKLNYQTHAIFDEMITHPLPTPEDLVMIFDDVLRDKRMKHP